MNRPLPRILQALTLLPALAAVAVLNVDWTRQGHIHVGSFGVIQHQHGHTGDHSHSHSHPHSPSDSDNSEPHSHAAEESVDQGVSRASEESGQHGGSDSPEPAGGSDCYLTSNLVLASEIYPPISVGPAPRKPLWTLPWVEDRPAPDTRHRPSAPRGPPYV